MPPKRGFRERLRVTGFSRSRSRSNSSTGRAATTTTTASPSGDATPTTAATPVTTPPTTIATPATSYQQLFSGPLDHEEAPWDRVTKDLDKNEREILKDFGPSQTGDILKALSEIHGQAEKQKEKCDERETFEILGKKVKLREKAANIVRWVEKLEGIGDIASAADPIHAGLPWAAVKFILKATTANFEERAGIISGMESSFELINRLYVYLEFLRHVPASKMRTNLEGSILPLQKKIVKFLLYAIKVLADGGTGKRYVMAIWTIGQVEDFDNECARLIKGVESDIQSCHRELSWNDRQNMMIRLEDISMKIDAINQFKQQLNTIEDVWKSLQAEKRGNILEWISKESPKSQQDTNDRERVQHTCAWLLKEKAFKIWKAGAAGEDGKDGKDGEDADISDESDESDNGKDGEDSKERRLFWLHGRVGSGKSFVTSKVINDIRSSLGDNDALAYYYIEKGNQSQTHEAILRSLVKQLAVHEKNGDVIHSEIVKIYDDRQKQGELEVPLKYDEIFTLFSILTEKRPKLILVLDGLDECETSSKEKLLDTLRSLLKSIDRLWIFVSSRPDEDIDLGLPSPRADIDVEATRNGHDIMTFIDSKLNNARNKPSKAGILLKDEDFFQHVSMAIFDKSDGMFQWVALQVDQVSHLKTSGEIESQLEKFPKGLNNAYETIFNKIESLDGDKPVIAKRAFQWLFNSKKSIITTSELILAVVQDGTVSDPKLVPKLVPPGIDMNYILDACQNLIMVRDVHECAWSHISVREYLEAYKKDWVEEADAAIAAVCLMVLNEEYTTSSSTRKNHEHSLSPLVEYACLFWRWVDWLDMAGKDSRARMLLRQFLGLLDPSIPSMYTCIVRNDTEWASRWNIHPLWFIVDRGLESTFSEVCATNLQGVDLNERNQTGYTLLEIALSSNSRPLTNLEYMPLTLLKLGAEPTEKAFRWAVNQGLESTFKLLMKHSDSLTVAIKALEVYKYRLDYSGFLPSERESRQYRAFLLRVLQIGKESRGLEWYQYHTLRQYIIKRESNEKISLPDPKIDLNYRDPDFPLPLTIAVRRRDEDLVRYLLDNSADPNGDEYDRPIIAAVKAGSFLVDLLIKYRADPSKEEMRNGCTRSALGVLFEGFASIHIMTSLIEAGANPDALVFNKSAEAGVELHCVLYRAIINGNEDCASLLIETEKVDVNGQGKALGEPLRAALETLQVEIMLLLIKNGADARKIHREWIIQFINECRRCMSEWWHQNYAAQAGRVLSILQDNGAPVEEADFEAFGKIMGDPDDEDPDDEDPVDEYDYKPWFRDGFQ